MAETPPAHRRPTIREVAAAAGVSRGTVSRVINGGHWVSPDSRARVEAAMQATGYRANHHARSLASGRANSFAFLLTEEHHLLFSDPTFSLLLRAAAAALTRRGMTLVLLVAGTAAERASVADYVSARHVDGVMLISSHEADPFIDSLVSAQVPTVACGIPLGQTQQIPYVSVDEDGSTRTMVRYLRQQGHRRIAIIAGPQDTAGGRFRLEAFRDELGADFDPQLVEYGDWGRASGDAALTRLLLHAPQPGTPNFDAVFASSDSMAAGAIMAAQRAGLTIPDDLAIAGFDDSGLAETLDPPLTTMRQPWDDIGEAMVQQLQALLNGTPVAPVTLPATLQRRASA